jgi:long-chain acyl-CoA synthetase
MNQRIETLGDMVRLNAERYRSRVALLFGDQRITYETLNNSINRLARGLRGLGIGKGDRVAILLVNSPEFIVAYFATLKLGATVVPLNHMFKTEELHYILGDAEASVIITASPFYGEALQLRLRLEKLKHIIGVDQKSADIISLEDIYEENPARELPGPSESDDIAVILYTSGTTGRPKGAMLTHHNLLSNAAAAATAIHAGRHDNVLCMLPLFHSFAWTACILLPFSVGGRSTIVESPRPFSNVIRNVLRHRVTIFVGVPSLYNILKDAPIPRLFTTRLLRFMNPLRMCISGAAALPEETLRKFEKRFRLPLLEGYGLTEASPVVSINPLKGVRKPGSIGVPIEGVDVAIATDEGALLGPDEVGELVVKGPNIMKGYFKLPDETEVTLKDGWLWTGDMAKQDSDGYLYIVDRKKDMVNVRGLNVYPKEIEEVLYQDPRVVEAAVIAIKDEHKGEVPKAFVALKDGCSLTESELVHFCRDRIAPYKVPKHVEFRQSLPKNATGKILKKALRAEEESRG